jgi:hypothetical protein
MLVVETVARIRREHFIKGKTIKEIARDLKVSRNTVRKVLRSGETSFEYEREVQPRPKLGRWTEELDALLASNAVKPAREQLTLIRLFEELRGRGYDGGYDAVRRYARRWAKERGQTTAAAYVPLSFAPGEAFQFDWSHEVVLLSGVTVIVKVAHVRLCHSRMMFVRAYPRETQEMVFDAHDRAFALFKLLPNAGASCRRRFSTSYSRPQLRRMEKRFGRSLQSTCMGSMIVRLMQRDREQCRSPIAWEVRNCDRRKKLCFASRSSRVRDERNHARRSTRSTPQRQQDISAPIISTRLTS